MDQERNLSKEQQDRKIGATYDEDAKYMHHDKEAREGKRGGGRTARYDQSVVHREFDTHALEPSHRPGSSIEGSNELDQSP